MANKTYRTIIEKIARTKSSSLTVFADFCRISACTLSAGAREEEYFEAIKSYSTEELKLLTEAFALMIQEAESRPFLDIFGEYYLEIASHSSKQARGEFYTPPHLCELVAKLNAPAADTIPSNKPITVSDPCCGSGNMILAFAKQFSPHVIDDDEKSYVDLVRATCQDINPVAVDMCFINTTLWGIPAKVILGNALSRDTPQEIFRNIHWFRVGEHQREEFQTLRNLISNAGKTLAPEETEKPNFQEICSSPTDSKPKAQSEFDFDLSEAHELQRGR